MSSCGRGYLGLFLAASEDVAVLTVSYLSADVSTPPYISRRILLLFAGQGILLGPSAAIVPGRRSILSVAQYVAVCSAVSKAILDVFHSQHVSKHLQTIIFASSASALQANKNEAF